MIKRFLLAGAVIPMLAIVAIPVGAEPAVYQFSQARPDVDRGRPDADRGRPDADRSAERGRPDARPGQSDATEEDRRRRERGERPAAARPDRPDGQPPATPPAVRPGARQQPADRAAPQATPEPTRRPVAPMAEPDRPRTPPSRAQRPGEPDRRPDAPAAGNRAQPAVPAQPGDAERRAQPAVPGTRPQQPARAPVADDRRSDREQSDAPAPGQRPGVTEPSPRTRPVQSQPRTVPSVVTPAMRPDRSPDRPNADRGTGDRDTRDRDTRDRASGDRPSSTPFFAAPDDRRPRRLEDVRRDRRESREDGRTVIREPGRTIIRDGDRAFVRHDDTARFRGDGRNVSVQQRGRDRVTTVMRPDGVRIVTVYDDRGRLLRRSRIDRGGDEVFFVDNRRGPSLGFRAFVDLRPPTVRIPRDRYIVSAGAVSAPVIHETLQAPPVDHIERAYAFDEVLQSVGVRDRMRRVDIDTITFDTGSWEITPDQAARLEVIAEGILRAIRTKPTELFLIEGHTDAVGSDIDNLSLSDRRAESVAMVLTERFGVPPENLATQGYGEEFLKVPDDGPVRENRRVAVRRITPLLEGSNEPAG